jgi:hypothetical protein
MRAPVEINCIDNFSDISPKGWPGQQQMPNGDEVANNSSKGPCAGARATVPHPCELWQQMIIGDKQMITDMFAALPAVHA